MVAMEVVVAVVVAGVARCVMLWFVVPGVVVVVAVRHT
jgi:hypothetical protein